MINIQAEITKRAVEMLNLPKRSCYILDIGKLFLIISFYFNILSLIIFSFLGCGSGLSGQVLEEAGHFWVGCDISQSMLNVANETENAKGDLVHSDMGQGLPFKPGTFDGIISISALQWLCYSNASDQDPKLRLNRFFSSLYSVMKKDARAILQFYPENPEQIFLISQCASKVGFAGGVVIDYPNSAKAKKYYLCLSFERSYQVPTALTGEEHEGIQVAPIHVKKMDFKKKAFKSNRLEKGSVEWVKQKKEKMRSQGKQVKSDSKYTGRKRSAGF